METSLGRSISFGPFRLYPAARVIERDGARLALGSRAFDVLIVLAERAGEVVRHRELTERVWRGLVVEPGTLRVHISGLRKALGGGNSQYIANVPGQGYCFVAPIQVTEPDQRWVLEPRALDSPEALSTRHNLPSQLTSFIGRENEIQQLKRLLAANRLVTLTGSGGCGKTRLALQLTTEIVSDFPDECRLIELAPLGDPALVAQSVANVLAVKKQEDRSLGEAIAERLATRRVLLVLDNAEHLIESCAELTDLLLSRCSGLKILVTSREPLGVGGELTYRVPSLTIPDAEDATPESVLACEAARLFLERARLHRPDFEITSTNASALRSICHRLDGIALAIELAAPRVRTMSIEELNRRLDNRFGILTGGHRTALPRHRTLRSLIDWSYDLLNTAEKTLLRRAAVFAGGMTADSAERVCAGDSVDRGNVLDVLTSLTDKNLLVVATHDGGSRFAMLETMRHYAWARLHESGEEETLRLRHVEYFLALSERLEAMQTDSQRGDMLGRMDVELDNVRAALAWCEATAGRSLLGLRLAGKLDQFWLIRGHFGEGRAWLSRLFASTPAGEPTDDHAIAHHTAGILAYHQSDDDGAEEHFRKALTIFTRLGNRRLIARTLGNLGNLALRVAEGRQTARECYEQGLAIAREIGDRRTIVSGLHCLGLLARDRGDVAEAQALFEEGLAVAREMGNWSPVALLQELGNVRQQRGYLLEARELFMEALAAERRFGNKPGFAAVLTRLGDVSHELGDVAAAKGHFKEALVIQHAMNSKGLANTLEAFASLCATVIDPCCAARLFGRVELLREELIGSSPVFSFELHQSERWVAAARLKLHDDGAFDRAWSEGRSMTLAEAVRYALET